VVEGPAFLPLKSIQSAKMAGGRLTRSPAMETMVSTDIAITMMKEARRFSENDGDRDRAEVARLSGFHQGITFE
jgi:hypothetical protein